jgi:hypothetical protein
MDVALLDQLADEAEERGDYRRADRLGWLVAAMREARP